jgi:hypothetical protein
MSKDINQKRIGVAVAVVMVEESQERETASDES